MDAVMTNRKSGQVQHLNLSNARVLVVEDEFYIADDLRRTLDAAGAAVVGPVSTLRAAEKHVDAGDFDCAVIDLNLHGESAVPLARRLVAAGKSFAIATGYGSGAVPPEFKEVPRIEKPFDPAALLHLVGQLNCAKKDEPAA
jgi:DNA-binding NtrC family response regulator